MRSSPIQKAIAKITISRSKESTDALMNSNDRMMEKVYGFENLLEQSNKRAAGTAERDVGRDEP